MSSTKFRSKFKNLVATTSHHTSTAVHPLNFFILTQLSEYLQLYHRDGSTRTRRQYLTLFETIAVYDLIWNDSLHGKESLVRSYRNPRYWRQPRPMGPCGWPDWNSSHAVHSGITRPTVRAGWYYKILSSVSTVKVWLYFLKNTFKIYYTETWYN